MLSFNCVLKSQLGIAHGLAIPYDSFSQQAMFSIGSSSCWVSPAGHLLDKLCLSCCKLLQRLICLAQMSTLFDDFVITLSKLNYKLFQIFETFGL